MTGITKDVERTIIKDFAHEIKEKREEGPKPQKHIIPFRNDEESKRERDVWQVPINLLRYRKDNGRIISDVIDYETNNFRLKEDDAEDQELIRKLLAEKDPEKTDELMKSIIHSGQREPAVITCDGFLINGNRRKMVFENLLKKTSDQKKYGFMKVVILPNHGEPGGPPTEKEIEELESRYQLQSDGKSQYHGFDRAISIRRKVLNGYSLVEQLMDDPRYANYSDKEMKKIINKYNNDFLYPLECVDRYLSSIDRENRYKFISAGVGDREGRWQAFIDYSQKVYEKLKDDKKRLELGISEDEVGDIEDIAFKIIRMREFKDGVKLHAIMRLMPKLIKNSDSKKELSHLLDVDYTIPDKETRAIEGKDDYEKRYEDTWRRLNKKVVERVMNAKKLFENRDEKETPLNLLNGALKKLQHDKMDITAIALGDLKEARTIVSEIQTEANLIENKIYHCEKDFKKLTGKNKIDY